MPQTLFEYLYRDAGNYKAFGSVVLKGGLSEAELERVRACFPGDGFFIAEQISVPALYEQLYQWSGGPTASDHCWHQFLDVRLVDGRNSPPAAQPGGTARRFLRRLSAVKDWKEELSPHFWLDL